MARDRVEVPVDGITYSMCQISPTRASLIFLKLIRIFGPALPKAFKDGKLPSMAELKKMRTGLRDISLDKVVEAIGDRMEEEAIMKMARSLLSQTFAIGTKTGGPQKLLGTEAMFDAHFGETSGLFHIVKVVKEVFLLQYADFFEGLGIQDKLEVAESPDTESHLVP